VISTFLSGRSRRRCRNRTPRRRKASAAGLPLSVRHGNRLSGESETCKDLNRSNRSKGSSLGKLSVGMSVSVGEISCLTPGLPNKVSPSESSVRSGCSVRTAAVRPGAILQSFQKAPLNQFRSVRLAIFLMRQIYGSCFLVSTSKDAPQSESLATDFLRAAYKSRSRFVTRSVHISLEIPVLSASREPVRSRRNSFATSSIMSGVTLGNRLAYVVIRALSQIVLISRGKPAE
jgi:hypothetical protein